METIGIVGAGQMGRGIAQVCAMHGLNVILHDISESTLRQASARIALSLERASASDALALIRPSVTLAELSACDFLIEAATENLQIKQGILRDLAAVASPGAVIATNTSSVSISMLAGSLADPARFIGMHFFNPVPVMGLVEIIRGLQTSDATRDATLALARRLGKAAIEATNSPGFVVNRLLIPMINEALLILQEEVASAEAIDESMKLGANHPLGPLTLADLIGLDTVLAIMETLCRDLNDSKYQPARLLRELVDAGYLGRKSKKGIFNYT
jgi:3-hydroxybutyryl-CoA dehydrogenase